MCDPADTPVIVDQFDQDAAGQNPLGAIGNGNVWRAVIVARDCKVGAQCGDQVSDGIRCPDRRRRFKDDQVIRFEYGRDRSRGTEHITDVRGVVFIEWSRDGYKEHVRRLDRRRCSKQAACDDTLHERIKIDFLDMHLPRVDGIDHALVDVDAQHRRT